MAIEEQLEHLLSSLQLLCEKGSLPLSRASRKIGRYPAYLSRAFAGRHDLKVEDTFKLLSLLKLDAKDFLQLLFPFGGAGAAALVKNPPPSFEADTDLRELAGKRRQQRGELHISPAKRRQRAQGVLKAVLRRKKVSQRQASLHLEMGPSALGQALRGSSKLTWRHVFGVLEACEVTTGRFVMELFGPDDDDLLESLRWSWYLDEIEADFGRMMSQASQRAGGKNQPAGAKKRGGKRS